MAKSAKKATAATKKTKKPALNDFLNQVKLRAYKIYHKRIQQDDPGDELHDWLKAEAEIKAKYNIK
jgi:hypothetical protein